MTTINDIVQEYNSAKDKWTTADWTHEFVNLADEHDEMGKMVYCYGDDQECAVCDKAKSDAEEALGYAEHAIDALQQGDLQEASYCARRAFQIEFYWGDAPTWGDFCRKVEAYQEEVENQER